MGTKVKNYFTGHFSMKDLNEDANDGRWAFQIEDKITLNGHYHGFCRSKIDDRSELNKEILKKTMLKHEDIFKEQVSELHRLYQVQKDLMKELRKKELFIYPAHRKTNPHLKLTENHNPIASTTFQQEDNMKESETTSNAKRCNKKLFDLQLPADEYIESDDRECTKVLEMPSCQNHYLGENSNINLTFSLCEIPINGRKVWKSDPLLQKRLKTHYFADSNEPSHKISDDTTSDPVNFLGSITLHEDVQHQKLTGKSSSVYGLPSDFFQENLRTNIPNVETGRTLQGWLSSDIKDGEHGSKLGIFPSSYHERSSMSGASQFQLMKAPDSPRILLSDHNKRRIWSKGSYVCDIDISEECPPCFKNPDKKNDHLKTIKGVDLNMIPENGFQDEESQIRQDILVHSNNGTSLGVLCSKSQLSCDYSSNELFHCSRNTSCFKLEIGDKQQKSSQGFVQDLVEMNIKKPFQSRDIRKPSEEKKLGKIPIEGIQPKLSNATREVSLCSHFRNFIDLNSTLEDCNEELVVKDATDISLEVPLISAMEKEINRGDILKITNSETRALTQDYESNVLHNELDAMAADIIVSLSSDFCKYEGQITHFDPSSDLDPLCWFSEIVSLQAINERARKDDGQCALDTEDNFFEMMTLNLKEMKVDENMLKTLPEKENQKEKGKDVSSLLTLPRRGQARRRQRRDFRKDILPGLASLSRHEITEDLQIIINLMKTSGHSWQTRRNVAKNVWTCRTKVKNLVVPTNTVKVQDSERPASNGLSLDAGNLKGWGKTIRRRQRSRFHVGNTPSISLM